MVAGVTPCASGASVQPATTSFSSSPALPYTANGANSKQTSTTPVTPTSTKRQSSFRFFSKEPRESASGGSTKSQGSNSGSNKDGPVPGPSGSSSTGTSTAGGPGMMQSLLARTSSFRASSFRASSSLLGSLTRKSSVTTTRTTTSTSSGGTPSFQEDFSFDNVY
jgi:hypothetical protein